MKNTNLKFTLLMALAVGSLSQVANASHAAASAHQAGSGAFVTANSLHEFEVPVGQFAEELANSRGNTIDQDNLLINLVTEDLDPAIDDLGHGFTGLDEALEPALRDTDNLSRSKDLNIQDLNDAMKSINGVFKELKIISSAAPRHFKKIKKSLSSIKDTRKKSVESNKKIQIAAKKAARLAGF